MYFFVSMEINSQMRGNIMIFVSKLENLSVFLYFAANNKDWTPIIGVSNTLPTNKDGLATAPRGHKIHRPISGHTAQFHPANAGPEWTQHMTRTLVISLVISKGLSRFLSLNPLILKKEAIGLDY